jgi:hypothetical protein
MPAWGPVSRRVLIQTLRTLGFEGPFPGGNHMFMQRGTTRLRLPNPHVADVSVGLLARLLQQGGITREEWEAV